MCCFVSSLRISQVFKQEVSVAIILQYRNRRDAGKYPLSPHPVQGRNQSKFFPSDFGTFLPRESERLPREGNAEQERHQDRLKPSSPFQSNLWNKSVKKKNKTNKNQPKKKHSEKVCAGCGGCWWIAQHKFGSEIRAERLSLETTLH